jgi:hypothetical protein
MDATGQANLKTTATRTAQKFRKVLGLKDPKNANRSPFTAYITAVG